MYIHKAFVMTNSNIDTNFSQIKPVWPQYINTLASLIYLLTVIYY